MVQFANSILTVKKGQVITGTEYGDVIAKAIAKAVAESKLETLGLSKDTEDDGTGVEVPTGKFVIDDETKFANWMTTVDKTFVIETPVKVSANLKDGQVWLSGMDITPLPATKPKVEGRVSRFHIQILEDQITGLQLTFETIKDGKIFTDNTALMGKAYLDAVINSGKEKPGEVGRKEILDWADKNLKGLVVVLGKTETVAGKTGYFKSLDNLNEIEVKAYGKLSKDEKAKIVKDDKGKVGFVHRTSGTNYVFVAIADDTRRESFTKTYSNIESIASDKERKRAMDSVELETLAQRNKINADDIENQISVAKRMLEKGLISQEMFDKRVNALMDNFGMK